MSSPSLTRGSLYGILDFGLGILEFPRFFGGAGVFFTLGILEFGLGIPEFLCDFSRNSRFYSGNSRF